MPGTVFVPNAGIVGSLIAMVIGTLLFLLVSHSFGYIMRKDPDNGGAFSFVRKTLGKDHAFLTAWVLGFSYISILWLNMNNLSVFTRFFFGSVLQWGFHYQIWEFDIFLGEALVEIGFLFFFGFLICFGKRIAIVVQTIAAIFLALSVVGLFIGVVSQTDLSTAFTPAFAPGRLKAIQVYYVLMFAPWMFIGFETVSNASSEFRFAPAKSTIIMAASIIVAAIVYILLLMLATTAMPPEFANRTEYLANLSSLEGIKGFPVLYAVSEKLGQTGVVILGLSIFAALTTSMIGIPRALANLLRAMATEKLLPSAYTMLNKNGIPQKALITIILVSSVIPFFGRTVASWFTDALSINTSLAFVYTSVCAWICAKRDGNNLYRRIAVAGIVISLAFFFLPLLTTMFLGNVFTIESYFLLAIWGIAGFILVHAVPEN